MDTIDCREVSRLEFCKLTEATTSYEAEPGKLFHRRARQFHNLTHLFNSEGDVTGFIALAFHLDPPEWAFTVNVFMFPVPMPHLMEGR
ncbi:hypothetical protein D3C84_724350 [compost metagenome]